MFDRERKLSVKLSCRHHSFLLFNVLVWVAVLSEGTVAANSANKNVN